jgi:hypothetical protein
MCLILNGALLGIAMAASSAGGEADFVMEISAGDVIQLAVLLVAAIAFVFTVKSSAAVTRKQSEHNADRIKTAEVHLEKLMDTRFDALSSAVRAYADSDQEAHKQLHEAIMGLGNRVTAMDARKP